MRSIEVSSQFKRDVKKNYLSLLTPAWGEVLNCLTNDITLPAKYKDHALTGNHKGFIFYVCNFVMLNEDVLWQKIY